jgi:hypothetical protein
MVELLADQDRQHLDHLIPTISLRLVSVICKQADTTLEGFPTLNSGSFAFGEGSNGY